MHEVDDELREIKREIIESRGLVIKTNNLTNALSADIKSIAKRQQGYERRISWNSAVAYIVFVVVVFAALKFAVDARVDAIVAKNSHNEKEVERLRKFEDEIEGREKSRRGAEEDAARFYDLVRQGKRLEVVRAYRDIKDKPLTKAELSMFADAAEHAKAELAQQLYMQGLDNVKLSRWAEAAAAFEQSLSYKEDSPVSPSAKLGLAGAYRKLKRQKEGVLILEKLVEQNVDKEVQDDALYLLASCQMDLEAWNDAKNTWRTLLRKFPESHFNQEAKLFLQQLNLYH